MEDLRKNLKKGALELGVDLGDKALDDFMTYLRELKAWNRKINLTSIDKDSEIITRHFLDSLTIHQFVKGRTSLLDIGAGAGFPGIPLKLVEPGLKSTLMDSVEKKVHFMRHMIRVLGLKGVEAVACRAEDASIVVKYGRSFDCVVARAFSELKKLLTISLPYMAPKALLVAIKGPAVKEELKGIEGWPGIATPLIKEVTVPFEGRANTIVLIERL